MAETSPIIDLLANLDAPLMYTVRAERTQWRSEARLDALLDRSTQDDFLDDPAALQRLAADCRSAIQREHGSHELHFEHAFHVVSLPGGFYLQRSILDESTMNAYVMTPDLQLGYVPLNAQVSMMTGIEAMLRYGPADLCKPLPVGRAASHHVVESIPSASTAGVGAVELLLQRQGASAMTVPGVRVHAGAVSGWPIRARMEGPAWSIDSAFRFCPDTPGGVPSFPSEALTMRAGRQQATIQHLAISDIQKATPDDLLLEVPDGVRLFGQQGQPLGRSESRWPAEVRALLEVVP